MLNNLRIVKNTVYLYFRMIIILLVSLYTSRIVLDVLGAEDYGIYGIVGSIVVLFTFLSNSMTGASQRFFSYELGKEQNTQIVETFSVSLIAHLIIIFIVFFLCETIGVWYLNNKLNIPEDRITAAMVVFQLSVATFTFNVIRIPYNAIIVSHERMSFFAYLSIIEIILKLLVVFLLKTSTFDKLIYYGVLILIVTILCTIINIIYCILQFRECRSRFIWDYVIFRKMLSFTSWSFCGNMANVAAQHGGNVVLNYFFNVVVNASYAIANQVSAAIYGFVSNFQMAFRPQITKLYASNNKIELWKLVCNSSKYSFYLLLLIAVPFIVNSSFILSLWLKEVPDYCVEFCNIIILYFLIDAIQAPLWMVIDATGKIKEYSIWLSLILFCNLPISFIILKMGGNASSLIWVRVTLNLLTAIIRTLYLRSFIGFPMYPYIKQCVKCLFVFLISFVFAYISKIFINDNPFEQIILLAISFIITILIVGYIGISKEERNNIINMVLRKYR